MCDHRIGTADHTRFSSTTSTKGSINKKKGRDKPALSRKFYYLALAGDLQKGIMNIGNAKETIMPIVPEEGAS